MEIRLNLVVLAVLGFTWAHLCATEPVASFEPRSQASRELAELEDAFAHRPNDPVLARQLAETYLELRRPGLAIAALRAGDPALLEHPLVAHRLAQAYEASGRVLDALSTADLALQRCARGLGTSDAPSNTPLPRHLCDQHEHAMLSMHHRALSLMVEWGVAVPGRDPRTEVAYDLALRRARVAMAE
ncbi:MAG: hypothetical protein H6720_16065 [Sandaracinus sp.]|nr:hypothetical protein [Sandaracinus sp.]